MEPWNLFCKMKSEDILWSAKLIINGLFVVHNIYFLNLCFHSPIGFDENEAVQQAIDNSLNNIPAEEEVVEVHTTSNSETSTECFQSTIKQHANEKVSGDPRTIVVSRLCVWATALPYFKKRGFLKGSGMLQVTLATFEAEEDAVDLGGQRREFFHLLLGAIMTNSGTLTSKINGAGYFAVKCKIMLFFIAWYLFHQSVIIPFYINF